MPKIRWQDGTSFFISTDDLVLPSSISLILRTVSVVLFLLSASDIQDCNQMFRWWVYASVIITTISIFLLARIVILCSRGGVFESEKRLSAVKLMRLRVCVFFPLECLLAVYGLKEVWFRDSHLTCIGDDVERKEMKVIAMWFAASLGQSMLWVLMLLRSRGGNKKLCHGWLLGCLLRCSARADNEAVSFISALARDFEPGVDLAFTDTLAAVALLWRRAKMEKALDTQDVESPLTEPNKVPESVILEMERACWIALTVYGWPLEAMRLGDGYFCAAPCCALAIPFLNCCAREGTSEHDNCCRCHGAALSSNMRNMNQTTVQGDGEAEGLIAVHASWVSGYCVPNKAAEHSWAVFLDKKTKCVVVSVRGTLSASDTVVDFWCENTPVPSSKESSGVSEMCHAGALMSAQGVFEEIMESGVLQALLDRGECPIEGGDLSVEWSEASSYDLMLVGHSLGGGIASLLSQIIATTASTQHWGPRLKCRLISPVGGLYTRGAADASDLNTISVTLGDEAVTSLSRNAVEVVRDDGLLLLAACPYHKLTILFSAINTYFSSSQTLAEEHYSWPLVEFPLRSLAPEDKFSWARSATQGSCINIVETCFCNYTEKGYAEVMYAPGRMIHLKRTCSKKEKRGYEAEWVSKEDLASGGHLALSVLFPGALTDHFPWYMIDAFSHVLKRK